LVSVIGLVVSVRGSRSTGGAAALDPGTGRIDVVTTPPGASIVIEFQRRSVSGTSPEKFDLKVEGGIEIATVHLRMTGFVERRMTVPVVAGVEQHVRAELKPE
jgi:hypothetical protein